MNYLAQLASDWRGDLPPEGIMCERKFNGWRALYFQGIDGQTRLWSRNGVPLSGADHVFDRLAQMEAVAGEPIFIDGEIVVTPTDGTSDTLAATKHWFETGWKRGGNAGVFHAFDMLTFTEWQAGGTATPLIERKARLKALFDASEPVDDGWTWTAGSRGAETPIAVSLVEDTWAFDARDVMTLANCEWAIGNEGLVLKDPLSPYQRNRNAAWLKVKAENAHKWNRRAA